MYLFNNLLFLLSGFFYECYCIETLPVFLLDNEKVLNSKYIDSDPLTTTTPKQFSEIIRTSVKSAELTLLFIEETFCREDASLKDNLGTPYFFLREGLLENKVKYLPSVEKPYTTLTKIFHPQPFNVFYISSSDYKPQIPHNMKYFYFYFKDENNNKTRSEVLRQHDFIIKEIYKMVSLQSKKPIIAIYTGKYNPIVFERDYSIKPRHQVDGVFIRAPRGLFYFKGISNMKRDLRTDFSYAPVVIEDIDNNVLRTTMAYSTDFEIAFNFILDPLYWTIDSVVWKKNNTILGRTYIDATVRWGRSYACGEPIVIRNRETNDLLRIAQYQLQPLQDDEIETEQSQTENGGAASETTPLTDDSTATGTPETITIFEFAKAQKCSGYMTAGILTCLLLSFSCLCLIIISSHFLMSIQSNDRFDDSRFQILYNSVKE